MKSFLSALFIILFHSGLLASSIDPKVKAPLIEHLVEINKHWEGKSASNEMISFQSDDERIQAHLFGVYEYLSANKPNGFSEEALAQRTVLLEELKKYTDAKSFPRNTGHQSRTPYFIDQFNTACAVGNLIIQAGDEELALSVKENFNFNYIADMPQEPIELWASNNGFEVWELEWIQPGYAYYPTTRFQQKNSQLMSPVNKVHYIADLEMTCYGTDGENIYASQLSCVKDDNTVLDYGSYLNGPVLDFEYGFNDMMVASGEFHRNPDSIYGLAMIENPGKLSFWKMPNNE